VGVRRGIPEAEGNPFLEILGQDVLENLGFGVDPIPGNAQRRREKGLDQAVMANDLEGGRAPAGAQPRALVRRVLDHSGLRQLLEHVRGGCRGDSEALRHGARRDRLWGTIVRLELLCLQVDCFEVVLGGG
jgi:hypothetical protein